MFARMHSRMELPELKPGNRVRLNVRGKARWRLSPARTGIVVGVTRTQCRVQWDGVKLPQVIHRIYLEPDEPS
jgi:hypothetical protein